MPISVERIRADIEAIGRITETPGAGATRPTFSPAWGRARQYVIDQCTQAGCDVRTDAAGNVHARPKALGWEAPAWLCGSHIDTVPHGGDYDGVVGVVVAMELLRSAVEDKIAAAPIEFIVFAEEEGPTFGVGMLGSRAWVGELSAEQLANLRNASGQTYLEAGAPYGVDAKRLTDDRIRPERVLGMIEVHIEQGPGMWRRDQWLAIVGAIAGRRQYAVTLKGEANHAGATAMTDRRDALAGAAEIVNVLEGFAPRLSPYAVITVGRMNVQPNAVNVIADRVDFTIDFRAPDDDLLVRGDAGIKQLSKVTCDGRGLTMEINTTDSLPARLMNAPLCRRLGQGRDLPIAVSGALHDSAILAPHVPTAMLFVPSKDGISHNPAEFSRVEDIAEAARIVDRVVRQSTVAQLNQTSREQFVATCGRFFEHSPWIAERTWQTGRPFVSLGDLHEKLCQTVASATVMEQLELIRAHPDLVGKLAREGRLTQESISEQAAAGLSSLSESEIEAFEKYNDLYRKKFRFPFVICARQNRKDAILAAFPVRLNNSREQEIATALTEIFKIARLRLEDTIAED